MALKGRTKGVDLPAVTVAQAQAAEVALALPIKTVALASVQRFREEADRLLLGARELVIEDEGSRIRANGMLAEARVATRRLDETRLDLVRPINDRAASVTTLFRYATGPLVEADAILVDKLDADRKAQEAIRQEQQRQAEQKRRDEIAAALRLQREADDAQRALERAEREEENRLAREQAEKDGNLGAVVTEAVLTGFDPAQSGAERTGTMGVCGLHGVAMPLGEECPQCKVITLRAAAAQATQAADVKVAEVVATPPPAVPAPVERTARTAFGTVTITPTYDFVIENEAAVPRDYCKADPTKIRQAMNARPAGGPPAPIPGVRWIETTATQVRT